ncbi:putative uncharacterized protein DDB_G0284213 isoform X2 [Octopus sinensis]|uniref:VPS9 domain-containing protein n=1 Tax=Octopus sinensis TaxID=2607531 RepID=A0A6P7TGW4_9MOLL|nr:putative uncharacterized protein DDB_G0284213 isoform X2 [Octopus sinensis]
MKFDFNYIFTAEYFYVAIKMAADVDELDINPVYQALQTNFLSQFEEAQEKCYVICIPQSSSLTGVNINSKFIKSHLLKPSPFFKGQYYTSCSKGKIVYLEKNELYLEGFFGGSRTKILNEEIGYNKIYKPYKILVLDKPLDPTLKPAKNGNKSRNSNLFMPKPTAEECCQWLLSFPEFEPILNDLDIRIRMFNTNYMVLPCYLENTATHLSELAEETVTKCCACAPRLIQNDIRFLSVLNSSIESYILENVYDTVFPVIRQHHVEADQALLTRCIELSAGNNLQIGIAQQFDCDLPEACNILQMLDSLKTPLEKLISVKSCMDSISSGISQHTEKSRLFHKRANPSICITSDDLIPLLVKVLIKAQCPHLQSNIFYMDVFNWSAASKDKDNISYCLVTLKAAVIYMKEQIMTTSRPLSDPTPTIQHTHKSQSEAMGARMKYSESSSGVTSLNTHLERRRPPKSLDETMDNITRRLREISNEEAPVKNKRTSSIFGPYSKKISITSTELVPTKTSTNTSKSVKKPDLGDFLSNLQDDVFCETCG